MYLTREKIRKSKKGGESVTSSNDVFSEDDGLEEDMWDDSFVDFDNQSHCSRQKGKSQVKFEGKFGGNPVFGYILGSADESYGSLKATQKMLHNSIEPVIYDRKLTMDNNPKYRSLLRKRLNHKRVVILQKTGMRLSSFIATVPDFGVTRFLREFVKQYFNVIHYIHSNGFRKYLSS